MTYTAYTNIPANADLDTWLPGDGRTVPDIPPYLSNNAVFNVKDYGAVGDGVTDDTNAFLAACASAGTFNPSTMPRVVRVPAGTYLLTEPIYVRSGILVRGDGFTASVLKATHAATVLTLGASAVGGVVTSDGSGLVPSVADLWIESSTAAIGIDTSHQSGWAVRNCWFTVPLGIRAGGSDGLITGCTCDIGTGSGVFILVNGSQMRITDCETYGGSYGIRISSATNVLISGCALYFAKYASVQVVSGATVVGLTLAACHCATSTNSSYYDATNTHLQIHGDVDNLVVTGNTFRLARAYSIRCDTTSQGAHSIVGNNFFDDNGTSISYFVGAHVNVAANLFKNCPNITAQFAGTSGITLANNMFLNCYSGGSPTEYNKGIVNLDTAGANNFIAHNTTDSTSRYIASLTSGTTAYSIGNRSSYSGDLVVAAAGSTSMLERCYEYGTVYPIHLSVNGRSLRSAPAAPSVGMWAVGDIILNSSPVSAGYIGWVCVAPGTPGTWKTFGVIS